MLADEYGNDLSTQSAKALDAYDLGVRRFLGAEPGVADAFTGALEADSDLALAHIGLAREMQMRAQLGEDGREFLFNAPDLAGDVGQLSQLHLFASEPQ